ncbi:MAG TPA: flavodoxin [Candidatus Phocaeicola gallinarum]|nr:flavodoxin [Candidatus Phocaeicola gallinarum]
MNKILLTLAAAMAICLTACAQNKEKRNMETTTPRTLVAYFSATGTTAKVARQIAGITGGTLYEITPQEAYTATDLDWNDKHSRSSVEMSNPQSRPELKESQTPDVATYDVVFIGYPIWWDQAPRVINTFIERHDLKGKTLIPFATSGGSGISHSVSTLKTTYPDLNWQEGKLLNHTDSNSLGEWVKSYQK